jgi:hypothetical protein
MRWILSLFLIGCGGNTEPAPAPITEPETDCTKAKNTCEDYSQYWKDECPEGKRCITFKNSCEEPVALAYQIGCNGDGSKGAPQCDCTDGKVLKEGEAVLWQIIDGDYESCLPSWQPPCLTAGLAVLANFKETSCETGTRIEFSAGNKADEFGKFCRNLYCNSDTCPDAYSTPENGGCEDGRSPQAGCQDTFGQSKGYTVEFCPSNCARTDGDCPSCLDAKACEEEKAEGTKKGKKSKAGKTKAGKAKVK